MYRGYLLSKGIKHYITDRYINNNEIQSTRWKKMVVNQLFNNYIELYEFFKKSKFLDSYRFRFHGSGFAFSMNSIKSKVNFYLV